MTPMFNLMKQIGKRSKAPFFFVVGFYVLISVIVYQGPDGVVHAQALHACTGGQADDIGGPQGGPYRQYYIDCDAVQYCTSQSLVTTQTCAPTQFSTFADQTCGVGSYTIVQAYSYSSGGSFRCNASTLTCVDKGFRVREVSETVPICIESGTAQSPLRIAKNGTIYGVVLVDPADPAATSLRIKVAGAVKALRKFTSSAVNFPNQSGTAIGHCNGNTNTFYMTKTITNTSALNAVFARTSTTGSGATDTGFTVPANSSLNVNFGQITLNDPGCNIEYPGPTEGSATYNISQNGSVIDTATYSWSYPQ